MCFGKDRHSIGLNWSSSAEAQKYDFKAQKMMMKIEMSEELQENEVPCLRTIRRLLDYAETATEEKHCR